MSKPVDPPAGEGRMPSEGTDYDALWIREAVDRLAAYHRGEIQTVSLADVLAKYKAA